MPKLLLKEILQASGLSREKDVMIDLCSRWRSLQQAVEEHSCVRAHIPVDVKHPKSVVGNVDVGNQMQVRLELKLEKSKVLERGIEEPKLKLEGLPFK